MGPLNAKQGQLSDWACSLCQINRTGEARAVSASCVKPSLSFCGNHFRSHVEKHAVLERGLLHTPVPLASYPHRVSWILSHSGIHSDAKKMFYFAAVPDTATGVLPQETAHVCYIIKQSHRPVEGLVGHAPCTVYCWH